MTFLLEFRHAIPLRHDVCDGFEFLPQVLHDVLKANYTNFKEIIYFIASQHNLQKQF